MAKRTIEDLSLEGRRVLMRVDFNVPIQNGAITDDTRIRASLATIRYALEHGARTVILCSHLGRPKGKPNPEFSLKPVADRVSALLGKPVIFAEDCVGEPARQAIAGADAGEGARGQGGAPAARVELSCSRTCAFIPRKRKTTRGSRSSSRSWRTST